MQDQPGDIDVLKARLRELLREKSVFQGEFTLASGAKSDFYVDSRLTALDPEGAFLIGAVGWKLVKREAAKRGLKPAAIGGLTMGADPVSLAIALASYRDDPAEALQALTVRKSPKQHGRTKLIEGNFSPGMSVVVVDDVITTGGSTLKAIDAVEEANGQVGFVVVLVDRQEGGRENIEARGIDVVPLFTREELLH